MSFKAICATNSRSWSSKLRFPMAYRLCYSRYQYEPTAMISESIEALLGRLETSVKLELQLCTKLYYAIAFEVKLDSIDKLK